MNTTFQRVKAFLIGMAEFRSDFTTHYDDYGLSIAYDWGREYAHRITLRRYDNA